MITRPDLHQLKLLQLAHRLVKLKLATTMKNRPVFQTRAQKPPRNIWLRKHHRIFQHLIWKWWEQRRE